MGFKALKMRINKENFKNKSSFHEELLASFELQNNCKPVIFLNFFQHSYYSLPMLQNS